MYQVLFSTAYIRSAGSVDMLSSYHRTNTDYAKRYDLSPQDKQDYYLLLKVWQEPNDNIIYAQ